MTEIQDYDALDFFRDDAFILDPYSYFDALREECPVRREPHHDVVMVTGYDEACAIYGDPDTWSSCTAVTGPFPGFPVPLDGRSPEEIDELIEKHRGELPMADQLPNMDPPMHRDHRGLLMRLLTPARLRENEDGMTRLADRQMDEFIDRGECDLIKDFAAPFTLYVIADLLGVPEEDHQLFRETLQGGHRSAAGIGGTDGETLHQNPLEFLYGMLTGYIEDRRTNPRNDVMTGLATATFPDGSTPEVIDVVRVAANLFGAGQETTVRLLGAAFQFIGEQPELQAGLRANPASITNFVEETLRMESPVKGDFRLSKRPTTVGGVDIPAGTTVMVVNGAANRDPAKFSNPATFQPDRENSRQHLAFGRGIHTCPGGPLARAEGRVAIERFLARTTDIRISESAHGPAGARKYAYAPTYILRGLNHLNLEFDTSD